MASKTAWTFRDFQFGFASAEAESAEFSSLLTEGFYDHEEVTKRALSQHRFIVVGNKGSGKSALAKHLELTAEGSRTLITSFNLKDFPYSELRSLVDGGQKERIFPLAWSWLLLLTFLNSFAQDESGNARSEKPIADAIRALSEIGFLPTSGLDALLKKSVQKRVYKIRLPLGAGIETETDEKQEITFPFFVDRLRAAMTAFRSSIRHLIILDDLDEVLNLPDPPLESLTALILESQRLNQAASEAGVLAKVVLLCRTDLFDRLPNCNTNKLRQDYSIRLDWYSPGEAPSPLWGLANLRASVQAGAPVNVVEAYLPPNVQRNRGVTRVLPRQPTDTRSYLLRHTRYTPRDFVRLLAYLQGESRGAAAVAPLEIANALVKYATDYFVPEIRDELRGYFTHNNITMLLHAFGTMRDNLFSFSDLKHFLAGRIPERILRSMLEVLFDCSAIGNWERGMNASLRTYRYKLPACQLSIYKPIVLHPALGLAFNGAGLEEPEVYDSQGAIEGIVKKILPAYGFVTSSDGRDFHFTRQDVVDSENVRLCVGDRVAFRPAPSKGGPNASAIGLQLLPRKIE